MQKLKCTLHLSVKQTKTTYQRYTRLGQSRQVIILLLSRISLGWGSSSPCPAWWVEGGQDDDKKREQTLLGWFSGGGWLMLRHVTYVYLELHLLM